MIWITSVLPLSKKVKEQNKHRAQFRAEMFNNETILMALLPKDEWTSK